MRHVIPRQGYRQSIATATLAVLVLALPVRASEIHVGAATLSITPELPVALSGQMHTRIAKTITSPISATALALESRDGDKVLDQAILVSCDLVAIREGILDKARQRIKERLPDFDADKLVLNATHTHTAPVMRVGTYQLPEKSVTQPAEFVEFLTDQIADAAVTAWNGRKPGSVGWGLGHAVVAQNRRALYANGTAQMYGSTNKPTFRGVEGYEDHGVEVLCVWDADDNLLATAINVACPSQLVGGNSTLDADFWHQIRESMKAKHGENLHVLGWTGAAGDQSPRPMYNKAAEERMRTLRGLSGLEELARRIVVAWEEAYEGASKERHKDAVLIHNVQTVELPERIVTKEEAERIKAEVAAFAKDPSKYRLQTWKQTVVDRYERQQAGDIRPYQMELHTIRLGDIAIATNDFELFTDFGVQMKARSPALQTFIIQLTGPGSYIPTERAEQGGGYSAIVESNDVGSKGGQVLTDKTVEALKALWPAK